MQDQWLLMEHYRLHIVEGWPDGAYKQATLAAIHSTLESLARYQGAQSAPVCSVCPSRKKAAVLDFSGSAEPSYFAQNSGHKLLLGRGDAQGGIAVDQFMRQRHALL